MNKQGHSFNTNHLLLTLLCSVLATVCNAFPVSHYAQQSQLSTGKWVKIAIPTDGVYELTADELHEMGFSDLANVQVYGAGGHLLSEVLDGSAIDDLKPVATLIHKDKLCFYGCGPVKIEMGNTATPLFSRIINPYSTMGYYFLTEGHEGKRVEKRPTVSTNPNASILTTSWDYFYHENDLLSLSMSGKTLLGENLNGNNGFDIELPGNASPLITLNIKAGVKFPSGTAALKAQLIPTDAKPIDITLSKSTETANASNYYTEFSPSASFSTNTPLERGKLMLNVASDIIIEARLDHFIVGYSHSNSLSNARNNQLRMIFHSLNNGDRVIIPQAFTSTVIWNIDNPATPVAYSLGEGEQGPEFITTAHSSSSCWVAFNPNKTLMKIAGYEHISNQNLHGMDVPHMLIITNKAFMQQAWRIANLHNDIDNMQVAVVDQEQIFNEFSSGTPDAMAYRLLCKMLYDRDSNKFKYLLLMGEGSYDNRGIATMKHNRILTYQSDNSYSESSSYTTDDFFGFLDDNSGSLLTSCTLNLGIGRIPSSNAIEAKNDVDKLIKYVTSNDYGPWRNNIFLSAEYKEEAHPDLHESQAECIANILTGKLNTGMFIDKAYVDLFPKSVDDEFLSESGRTSTVGNQHFAQALHRGQFFASYVGHAGPRAFTNSRLWTTNDVTRHTYNHLPIFTTACCDVARFDDDTRGIAEHMFHKTDGGAIALLTSTRQVISTSNDNLNRAWINSMFSWEPGKQFPTLGKVLLNAKRSMNNNINNMKFLLLGDPAMRINYPVPLFEITHIAGNDVTTGDDAHVKPLQSIEIKARVLKPDRSGIDTDFNGEATITIYDKERFFKRADNTFSAYITDIYYPRELLAQVTGKVVNGELKATVVLPRFCRAVDEKGLLQVYAHNPDNHFMVNGQFNNLVIDQFTGNERGDTQSPVITDMYLNDKELSATGATISGDATLYIHATDNLALNMQGMSMGNNMRLVLDGGKASNYLIDNYATMSNGGKTLDIAYPLKGLSQGEHTLSFTIHDVAGNTASHTLSFIVGNAAQLDVRVEEMPAVTQATIHTASTVNSPNLCVKVTDALGETVWQTTTNTSPVTWDLTDAYGRRVSGGHYKVFCYHNDGSTVSGSKVVDLVVAPKRKNPIKKTLGED